MTAVLDRVVLNPDGYELAGSSRWGFVHATVEDFEAMFGAPAELDPDGEKVSHYWYFETPAGRVCVRNWFANPRNRLSICSDNPDATEWVARFLREHKFVAYFGEMK